MNPPPVSSSARLRESLLRLLWQQWSALGVAGQVSPNTRSIVDPEALLLVSTVFARHDARLFDEIFDWLLRNGEWVNALRLVRIQAEHHLGDETVLAAVADHLSEDTSHLKWRTLIKIKPPGEPPVPLFPHLPLPNRTDSKFAHWGWLRPPLESRSLSSAPRTNHPASFLIKLRALFGRQSRAEIIAWLVTHEAGHPAQIARETGYFRGSVQNVLNELELSGHVQASRAGREKLFVSRRDQWRFLLTWGEAQEFPRWIPWAGVFALIRGVHDLIESPGFDGYSSDLQAMELMRVMKPIVDQIAVEGLHLPLAEILAEDMKPGPIVDRLESLITELA